MTIASLPVINRILNKLRRQTVGTREYIVAPVTLIVPGVLDGSEGPLYYPPHEIARNYHEWNDTPVTINHPLMNGKPVSARTPTVYLSQGVGRIHNARINSEGKLRAEAWIDVEALSSLSPSTLRRIEAGEPIEVSTGLYTTNIRAEEGANVDGKPYQFVARNYKPDHLAILPDQVGACSLNDGCGLNVNAKGKKADKEKAGGKFSSSAQRRAYFGKFPSGKPGSSSGKKTSGTKEKTKKETLTKVKGRIEWDGTPVEDPKGGKTLLKDSSGNLHGSMASYKRKQKAKKEAEQKKVETEKKVKESADTEAVKEAASKKSYEETKSKMKMVEDHAITSIKKALKAEGVKARVKLKGVGSFSVGDDPKAKEILAKVMKEYSAKGFDPYRMTTDEIGKLLASVKFSNNSKSDQLATDLVEDLIAGYGPTINIWSKRAREAAARARRAGGHVLSHFKDKAKKFALRQVAKLRSAPKRIAKALERKAEKITGKKIEKGKSSKRKPSKSRETLGKRQRILDAIEVKDTKSKRTKEKKPKDTVRLGGKKIRTFGLAKNSLREFLVNAGVNQPRSSNSGKYKKFGAGTGKGKGHEAAQRGSLQLTDEDYKEGRELVGNPGWVKDKAKWKKAKQAAKEGDYSGDQLWAVTTKIYKGMGGSITKQPKAKTMNSARERVIRVLTANCSCWKNKEETLRTMDGAQLNGVYQSYKATQNGKKGTKNKKKGKMDPNMMQDDEEAEGEGMETNSLSVKQWLQMMPESAKPIWNHAVNLEKETRKQLVEKLTANISDETKKTKLVEKLSKLPVADLQERLELVGNAQQIETQTTGSYIGQTGVIPTTNNGGTKGINKDEPLRRPTLNFQEMSKESRSA